MTSAVAKDFLTVPGIASLAVMSDQSPAYFCGIEQSFTAKQQALLSDAITGVLGSIPEAFSSFEFRWRNQQSFIYRVDYAVMLMVVVRSSLDTSQYLDRLAPFLKHLRDHREETLAELAAAADRLGITPATGNLLTALQGPEELPNLTDIQLQTIIDAFNSMAECVAYYLGKTVTTNQLKNSCPDPSWTTWVEIDRHAKLVARDSPTRPLTAIEYQQWQCWAQRFLQNCGKVLRNLKPILDKQLTDEEKAMLRF
jgi:hypothetical protein